MEFHKEILSQMLSRYEFQVTIPQLELDIKSLFELECYRALFEIKCILEEEGNSDEEMACLRALWRDASWRRDGRRNE